LAAQVGSRLRAARRNRRLTLQQAAGHAELTAGFLSQLERGRKAASIATYHRLCSVLGVSLSALFEAPPSATGPLLRRSERQPIRLGGEGVLDYPLTPNDERRFQVLETRFRPLGTSGEELFSFDADAGFMCILSGRLEVRFEDRTIALGEGDALTFSPQEPHALRNPSSDTEAVVMFVKVPALI